MKETYYPIILCIISILTKSNWRIIFLCVFSALALALFQNIISVVGATSLIMLGASSFAYYRWPCAKWIKACSLVGMISLVSGLVLHEIPGFYNQCIFNPVVLSPLSSPYVMYLNFDKIMAGIILCLASGLWKKEKLINRQSITKTIQTLLLCIVVILGPALWTGYVKIDPKLPVEIWIWGLNNLFFVCFAEEVIFRGCLQHKLSQMWLTKKWGTHISIMIASVVFGFFHIKSGGIIYMILASVCGLFYGYVYHTTQSIRCSMLVHFGLNLCHFILFTYPSTARLSQAIQ